MNPKTNPASHAPLSPMKDQTVDAEFMVGFQDLFALAMDQAIGIETAFGDLFSTAAHAFASCMELRLSLMGMMASHVSDTVETLSGLQAQITADVLERSMDIAIGAMTTAPSSTVATSSASQAKTPAAIGARAA